MPNTRSSGADSSSMSFESLPIGGDIDFGANKPRYLIASEVGIIDLEDAQGRSVKLDIQIVGAHIALRPTKILGSSTMAAIIVCY